MEYHIYRQSRDTAWQILLQTGAKELPIQLDVVCKLLGIRTRSYTRAYTLMEKMELLHLTQKTDGFTYHEAGGHIIFLHTTLPIPRQRFTVAHELGHIVLGHVARGHYTLRNREPDARDSPDEQAANAFAARLLAPACVLHFAGIKTAEQIEQTCNISKQAAQYRAERLAILKKRQGVFLQQFGKSCFFRSELEHDVYLQFTEYIETKNPSLPTGVL